MDTNYGFCLIGGCSDAGRVRRINEDSTGIFDTPNGKVVVVCDGMGGHAGGQVASRTAVAAIGEFLSNNTVADPREAIRSALVAANHAVVNRAQTQPELAGMGATCAMLLVTPDGRACYGHVGDSRIYIIASHRITQLTKDHSFVQMLVDTGQITRDEAIRHPRRNEITGALGMAGTLLPSICSAPVEPDAGNCFLLCSDGLTGMVDDETIMRIAGRHDTDIRTRATQLVQMANEAGGADNITVQLVEFTLGTADIVSDFANRPARKRAKRRIATVAALLFTGAAAFLAWKYFCPDTPATAPGDGVAKHADTLRIETEPILYAANIKQTVCVNPGDTDMILRVKEAQADCFTVEKQREGSCITIEWTKAFSGKQIEIECETGYYETCILTVPVTPAGAPGRTPPPDGRPENPPPAAIDRIEITTDTIRYAKEATLRIGYDRAGVLSRIEAAVPKGCFSATLDRNNGITIKWTKAPFDAPQIRIRCITTFEEKKRECILTIPVRFTEASPESLNY
ncbi:MAG: Stp1/IreP family PP2C-type Ser/Thr phosphatase [Tannerella sp.]|jgi:protein phosphatase|nr:Stp1/IreP family PP2C-type Ser/Thr phosphatase [Tannerella sp.]